MVKIRNASGRVLEVTRGAFNSIYRHIGYTIVTEAGNDSPASNDVQTVGDSYRENLEEKPIGEMNIQELREFASILGIDSEGKGKRALRAEILEHEHKNW